MEQTGFVFRPIGVIHSPHTECEKTPVQPVCARGVKGRVVVDPEYAEGLADLDGFSHIYLFYAFHRARETKLTVCPFLEDTPRGVFATRSPARPNKLGFSVVRLLSVEGNVLHVEDVDILDGTPLLDIKPYVARFDTRENVRSGWQDAIAEDEAARRGRRGFHTKDEPGRS
jgi:tRNA-Thr(GGU) m(6)t(6)A37 methyltransferase TsaA